jgi:flagellar transcriptional activator FlhD
MLHYVTKRYALSHCAWQRDASGSDCGGALKTFNETSESIREINLSYIMLVQRLLQTDRAAGMLRLGMSREVADILAGLTLPQVVKFAASNHLLCTFRFNDHAMLSALTESPHKADMAKQHDAVSMVRQRAVQFA